ncbi:MAG: maleylpyruvate isomerase family mycothiol-dependent enzyme [Chloroflexi bacterium]|nr:maleylpyruvate isomerase family mycothiol-dependent enzyme [Chloroflexota bacterium]
MSSSNPLAQIKTAEQAQFDRLTSYLEQLDADGWTEQSYCTDWLVYQVVSHVGSGSRIGGQRLKAWLGRGPQVSREAMQAVWGHFDSLQPGQMLQAYRDAVAEYLDVERSAPDDAGGNEVEGYAGRRPLWAYQMGRLWELTCHTWDVYVARDRSARLAPEAVRVMAANGQYAGVVMDVQRAPRFRAGFRMTDLGHTYLLDPGAERPRLQPGIQDCQLVVEGPAEEILRLIAGRHFLPGSRPQLRAATGSTADLTALRRAFRP